MVGSVQGRQLEVEELFRRLWNNLQDILIQLSTLFGLLKREKDPSLSLFHSPYDREAWKYRNPIPKSTTFSAPTFSNIKKKNIMIIKEKESNLLSGKLKASCFLSFLSRDLNILPFRG